MRLHIWKGRMALKRVSYHVRNESPVYVRYRIQDAWGWCMGMIQRDDMGWEAGGGFRIGNSCTPMADSCQCMAKPIQYCKAKWSKKKEKKGQSHSVELDLEVIPIEGHKTHIILYVYTHICIAISTLKDMDTDKDGCVNVYTYAHMRVWYMYLYFLVLQIEKV